MNQQARTYFQQLGISYQPYRFSNRGSSMSRPQRPYQPRGFQLHQQQFGYRQSRSTRFYGYRQQPAQEVRMPRGPYMPLTRASRVFCYTLEYPNHTFLCDNKSRTQKNNLNQPQKSKNNNHPDTLYLINVTPTKVNILSFVKLNFSPRISSRALIDTGGCATVIGKSLLEEYENDKRLYNSIQYEKPNWKHVKIAGGQSVEVTAQVSSTFKLAYVTLTETFIVLPKSNSIKIGNEIFIKLDITINPKSSLLDFPHLTVSKNEFRANNEPRPAARAKRFPIYTANKRDRT